LKDYYKILNVNFGASEIEIKKRFRRLASIHHPDKNGGSKKSEETFKIILNAYETLIDRDKRTAYDLKYKQHLQQSTNTFYQGYTQSKQPKEAKKKISSYFKLKINEFFNSPIIIKLFSWLIILVLISLITFIFNIFNKPKENNNKKDFNNTEIINKPPANTNPSNEIRPETGEINF
jgi:curved DNA-binding protein CbpA